MPRIRSQRVVFPTAIEPATLEFEQGKITAILPFHHPAEGADTIDAGNNFLLPGLIDAHIHINEPGRTEWEGFATATRAAAAGGYTTLVDMPLNCLPPTTTVENLLLKRTAAL